MPDKIQAVTNMTTHTSVTELQCFLGMCNFLSQNGQNQWAPAATDLQRHTIHLGTCAYRSLSTYEESDINSTNSVVLQPQEAYCPTNGCMHQRTRSCPLVRWTPCVFCIQITDNSTTELCSHRTWSFSCFMGSSEVPSLLVWETFHAANWQETTTSHPQQIPSGGYSMYAVLALTTHTIWHDSRVHQRWDQPHHWLFVQSSSSLGYHQPSYLASEPDHCTCKMYTR